MSDAHAFWKTKTAQVTRSAIKKPSSVTTKAIEVILKDAAPPSDDVNGEVEEMLTELASSLKDKEDKALVYAKLAEYHAFVRSKLAGQQDYNDQNDRKWVTQNELNEEHGTAAPFINARMNKMADFIEAESNRILAEAKNRENEEARKLELVRETEVALLEAKRAANERCAEIRRLEQEVRIAGLKAEKARLDADYRYYRDM